MRKMIGISLVILLLCALVGCTLTQPVNENETSTGDEPQTEAQTERKQDAHIPLLASDSEHDVYLYGIKPQGVVLYKDGEGHYYDWVYDVIPDMMPKISVGDFKYRSHDDIAVITYTEDGEVLRIITNGKFDAEDVYTVPPEQVAYYAARKLKYAYDEAGEMVSFTYGENTYQFDMSESFDKLVFGGVSFAKKISYEFADGCIYVNVIPVVLSEDDEHFYGAAETDITVRAKLIFDGEYISLDEFSIKSL